MAGLTEVDGLDLFGDEAARDKRRRLEAVPSSLNLHADGQGRNDALNGAAGRAGDGLGAPLVKMDDGAMACDAGGMASAFDVSHACMHASPQWAAPVVRGCACRLSLLAAA